MKIKHLQVSGLTPFGGRLDAGAPLSMAVLGVRTAFRVRAWRVRSSCLTGWTTGETWTSSGRSWHRRGGGGHQIATVANDRRAQRPAVTPREMAISFTLSSHDRPSRDSGRRPEKTHGDPRVSD